MSVAQLAPQIQLPEATQAPPEARAQVHTSVLLQQLIDGAPLGHFTLDWLIGGMPRNSFGVILLFLAIIALLPVISIPARLLILVLVLQIIMGYHKPVLPHWLMMCPLPSGYLTHLNCYAIPSLKHLEKAVRPRWPRLLTAARRLTAVIALLLTILSLLAPLPLSNVPPAAISAVMALAYIEHDGLLLALALFSAIAVLTIISVAILL